LETQIGLGLVESIELGLWCIHTHAALGWDGMGCAGNLMCFNEGVYKLSYHRNPSHIIPFQCSMYVNAPFWLGLYSGLIEVCHVGLG